MGKVYTKSISYKILGQNMKKIRIAAGLTQQKTAELIGISQLHYGRLERGERRTSIEHIEGIAKALSVSAEDLFIGCFDLHREPNFEHEDITELVNEFAFLLLNCTPPERKLCFDICQRISRGV